jgi:hypothetical protein
MNYEEMEQQLHNRATAGASLCIGSGEQSCLISRRALVIARWNAAVDVSLHENFDSMPNLMRSGAERSAKKKDIVEWYPVIAERGGGCDSQLIPYPS